MATGRNIALSLANRYGWTPPPGITPAAATAMDTFMTQWGGQPNIISAYRDPARNARVGGAKGSQHVHGNAFDIDVANMPPEQRLAMIQQAKQSGFTGIGVYDNSLHFDVGPQRYWGPDYSSGSTPEWALPALQGSPQTAMGGGPMRPPAESQLGIEFPAITEPSLPPSLLDTPASGDRGVTIADLETAQKGNKFHGGLALQSLGAAIAAGSQGLSAADALGKIREQYFAEQDETYRRQREEMARKAAVDMVGGPDSMLGRALLEGADLQSVLQTFAQERGFQQQVALSDRGAYHNAVNTQQGLAGQAALQDDSQRHATGMTMAQIEADRLAQQRGFAHSSTENALGRVHDADMQGQQIGADFAQQQLGFGNQREVLGQEHANNLERMGEQFNYDYTLGEQRGQQASSLQEDSQAHDWEKYKAELEEDRRNTMADLARSGQTGSSVKHFIANQLEKTGDTEGAKHVRSMRDSAFSDPSMVDRITTVLEQAPNQDAAQEKLREIALLSQAYDDAVDAGDTTLANALDAELTNSTTVNQAPATVLSDPDPGTALVVDPQSPAGVRQVNIPGGRIDQAEQAAQEQRPTQLRALQDQSDQFNYQIDQALSNVSPISTGVVGQILSPIWGLPPADLAASLSSVGSTVAFDRLQRMRDLSKSGGALGSIAVAELEMLRDSVAAIGKEQSSEQLRANLEQLRAVYNNSSLAARAAMRFAIQVENDPSRSKLSDQELADMFEKQYGAVLKENAAATTQRWSTTPSGIKYTVR